MTLMVPGVQIGEKLTLITQGVQIGEKLTLMICRLKRI